MFCDRMLRLVRNFLLALSFIVMFEAQAATVWLVEGGNPSNSNVAGSVLSVTPGLSSLDLYMDTQGDTSFGWNFTLNVSGTGLINNVTGAFVDANFGTQLPDGGWAQIGGDFLGETGEILVLSFDFSGVDGASIDFSGSFTNSSFLDETISSQTLLTVVQPIPVPAAVWLFGSALLVLIGKCRASS